MEKDKWELKKLCLSIIINRVLKYIKSIKPSAQTISSVVLTAATIILAWATVKLSCHTSGYLVETEKTRKLYENIVAVETTPKVFVKDVKGKLSTSDANEPFVLDVVITNCGKVEARDLVLYPHIFNKRDGEKIPNYSKPEGIKIISDLFPGQEIPIRIKPEYKVMEQNNEEQISYYINIELKYKDMFEKYKNYNCEFRYEQDPEEWVFNSEREDLSEIKTIFSDPSKIIPIKITTASGATGSSTIKQ